MKKRARRDDDDSDASSIENAEPIEPFLQPKDDDANILDTDDSSLDEYSKVDAVLLLPTRMEVFLILNL